MGAFLLIGSIYKHFITLIILVIMGKIRTLIDPKDRRRVQRAVADGDISILQRKKPFVKKKVEPEETRNSNEKLIYAARAGDLSGVDFAILKGADVDFVEDHDHRFSALMLAALNGSAEIAELLVESGANIEIRYDGNWEALLGGTTGWTPIMAATSLGHKETVEVLVDAGANVNARDNQGNSVLTYAKKNEEIFNYLKSKGAVE